MIFSENRYPLLASVVRAGIMLWNRQE